MLLEDVGLTLYNYWPNIYKKIYFRILGTCNMIVFFSAKLTIIRFSQLLLTSMIKLAQRRTPNSKQRNTVK